MKSCPHCGAKRPVFEVRKERNGDLEIECRKCGFRDIVDTSVYNYIMNRKPICGL